MQITLNYIYLFKYLLRIVLHFLLVAVHGWLQIKNIRLQGLSYLLLGIIFLFKDLQKVNKVDVFKRSLKYKYNKYVLYRKRNWTKYKQKNTKKKPAALVVADAPNLS